MDAKEPNIFIAIMGMTGAGKSTFISHCTDVKVAISDPGALQSCKFDLNVILILTMHEEQHADC